MKVMFEEEELNIIADKVIEKLKPLLSGKNGEGDSVFDVPQLCEYLHVTKQWVHQRTYEKAIPFIKLSNKMLRFKKKDIDKWLDSLGTPAMNQFTGKLSVIK